MVYEYMSTVCAHLLHCAAIWVGTIQSLIDDMFIAQKSRFADTNPLFCEHKLMKIPDIFLLHTCLFVYGSLHTFLINTTFQFPSHNINTRRLLDVKKPQCRTVEAQQSVSVRGAWSWNNLHLEIKFIEYINLFKKTKINASIFTSYEQ